MSADSKLTSDLLQHVLDLVVGSVSVHISETSVGHMCLRLFLFFFVVLLCFQSLSCRKSKVSAYKHCTPMFPACSLS